MKDKWNRINFLIKKIEKGSKFGTGDYEVELRKLLDEEGLSYRFDGDNVRIIERLWDIEIEVEGGVVVRVGKSINCNADFYKLIDNDTKDESVYEFDDQF